MHRKAAAATLMRCWVGAFCKPVKVCCEGMLEVSEIANADISNDKAQVRKARSPEKTKGSCQR